MTSALDSFSSDGNTLDEKQGSEPQPLSKRELYGWYLTTAAVEPYVVGLLSVFAPIILETYSSLAGFKLEDKNVPCDTKIENYKCVTKFGFWYVDTASYSFYIIAVSVLAQCLVYIGCGALADYGNNRKKMLLGFSYAGGLLTIGYILVLNPDMYWLAGLLTILSNVCYGAASVFRYGYIPVYTRIHPEVLEVKQNGGTKADVYKIEEKISSQLSVMMFVLGLPAGVSVLIVCSVIVLIMEDKLLALRIACVIVGVWWIAIMTFPALWIKNRADPPLPKGQNYFTFSFKRVGKTIKSAKQLVETMKFLVAWFILSDAFNTIVSVGILFAKKTLGLSQPQLLLVAIIVPTFAMIGDYIFLRIQRHFDLSAKKMIIITATLQSLVPMYGLLGFVAPFGLKQQWEIWLFAVYYGCLVGAVQSFCTVVFSSLIPRGHENEFFSLHEITDKGSSWFGPLITGIIGDVTHDLRYAYWYLLFAMAFPILITFTVNVDKGKKEAELFAENEENLMNGEILMKDDDFDDYEKETV